MNRYDPTDTMEEVRHGSYVLFEDAQKRIAELEELIRDLLEIAEPSDMDGRSTVACAIEALESEGGADE